MAVNVKERGLMLSIYLRIYKDKHPELYEALSSIPSSKRTEFVREALIKHLQAEKNKQQDSLSQNLQHVNERLDKIERSIQKLEELLAELLKNGAVNYSPTKDAKPEQQIDPFMEKLQKGIDQILSMGR